MDVQKAIIVGWTKNKNQNNWSRANCFFLGFQLQDGLQSDIFMAVFHRLQSFEYKSWKLRLVVPISIMAIIRIIAGYPPNAIPSPTNGDIFESQHQQWFTQNGDWKNHKDGINSSTVMGGKRCRSNFFSSLSMMLLINTILEWAGRLLQRCRCGPGHSSQVWPLAMACCVFV